MLFINYVKKKNNQSFKRKKRRGDKKSNSNLDKQTFLSSGPPCLASGDVCFCVWPHGGSTALRIEDWGLWGRRPEAGVVEGQ